MLAPWGVGRFVPCSIGGDHCRLRHIGWEKCGHGLTSRPRESASDPFLDELLGLFRYPAGSGCALLAGILPLRYCAARFACGTPTWRLPVPGCVVDLVTASVGAMQEVVAHGGCREVFWIRSPGPGRKRIQHTLQVLGIQLDHVCGKGCVQLIFLEIHILDTRRGVVSRVLWGFIHVRLGRGWDNTLCGACPRLRLARSEVSCLLRCMRCDHTHTFNSDHNNNNNNNNPQQPTTAHNSTQQPTTAHNSPQQHTTATQQQHSTTHNNTIWRGSVFNRRGASTPHWGVQSCPPPSRRPNPIPAIPPCVVRTPHLHGAPTTEETVKL